MQRLESLIMVAIREDRDIDLIISLSQIIQTTLSSIK